MRKHHFKKEYKSNIDMMIVFVAILPLLGSVESDSNHGKENEVVHQQYDYKRPDFDLSQLKVS